MATPLCPVYMGFTMMHMKDFNGGGSMTIIEMIHDLLPCLASDRQLYSYIYHTRPRNA